MMAEVSDLEASFDGGAVNSNRMVASHVAAGLRLSFLEAYRPDAQPRFRAAVLLSYQDAAALRDLLMGLLAGRENPQ